MQNILYLFKISLQKFPGQETGSIIRRLYNSMIKKQHHKTFVPILLGFYFFSQLLSGTGWNAPAPQTTPDFNIMLIGKVDRTQVPLNRTLNFVVVLSWSGGLDDFTLLSLDDPTLTNFVITGTSAAIRSEASGDNTRVINEYGFQLTPKELGMGYIESILAKVKNNIRDRELSLVTKRIPIEVTDPEKDPGTGGFSLIWYALPLLLLGSVAGWIFYRRIKVTRTLTGDQEPAQPLEEKYLQELKSRFDLSRPDLKGDFSRLSRLLRRYLTERYSLAALNATAEELSEELVAAGLESNQVAVLTEILNRSEAITFSGTAGALEEINRFYTQIEGLFLAGLRTSNGTTREE